MRPDWALVRHDISHINVTYGGTIVNTEYTTHGLHLNSGGKMRLTHFIADSIHGRHMPSSNSTTLVITHAIAPPFLGKDQEHRGA